MSVFAELAWYQQLALIALGGLLIGGIWNLGRKADEITKELRDVKALLGRMADHLDPPHTER